MKQDKSSIIFDTMIHQLKKQNDYIEKYKQLVEVQDDRIKTLKETIDILEETNKALKENIKILENENNQKSIISRLFNKFKIK